MKRIVGVALTSLLLLGPVLGATPLLSNVKHYSETSSEDPLLTLLLYAAATIAIAELGITTATLLTNTVGIKYMQIPIAAYEQEQSSTGVNVFYVQPIMALKEESSILGTWHSIVGALLICNSEYSFKKTNTTCKIYSVPYLGDTKGYFKYDWDIAANFYKQLVESIGDIFNPGNIDFKNEVARINPFFKYAVAKLNDSFIVVLTAYDFYRKIIPPEEHVVPYVLVYVFNKTTGELIHYARLQLPNVPIDTDHMYIIPYLPRAINTTYKDYRFVVVGYKPSNHNIYSYICNYNSCKVLGPTLSIPIAIKEGKFLYVLQQLSDKSLDVGKYILNNGSYESLAKITTNLTELLNVSYSTIDKLFLRGEITLKGSTLLVSPTNISLIPRISYIYPEKSNYCYLLIYRRELFPAIMSKYVVLGINIVNDTVFLRVKNLVDDFEDLKEYLKEHNLKLYIPTYPLISIIEGQNETLHYIWYMAYSPLTRSNNKYVESIVSRIALDSIIPTAQKAVLYDKYNITYSGDILFSYSYCGRNRELGLPTLTSTGGYAIGEYNIQYNSVSYGKYDITNIKLSKVYYAVHPAILAQLVGIETLSIEIPQVQQPNITVTVDIKDLQAQIPTNLYHNPTVNVTITYNITNINFAELVVIGTIQDLSISQSLRVFPNATTANVTLNFSNIVDILIKRKVTKAILNITAYLIAGNYSDTLSKNYTVYIQSIPVTVKIVTPQPDSLLQQNKELYVKVNITDPDTAGTYRLDINVYDENNILIVSKSVEKTYSKPPVNDTITINVGYLPYGLIKIEAYAMSPDGTTDTDSVNIYVNRKPTITQLNVETNYGVNITNYGYLTILPNGVNKTAIKLTYVVADDQQNLVCNIYLDNDLVATQENVIPSIANVVMLNVTRGAHIITVRCTDVYNATGERSIEYIIENPDYNADLCKLIGGYWTGTKCCGDDIGEEKPLTNSTGYVFLEAYCKNVLLPSGYCLADADCGFGGTYCVNETAYESRVYYCDTNITENVTITIDGTNVTLQLHKCRFNVTGITLCPNGYYCIQNGNRAKCKPTPLASKILINIIKPEDLYIVHGLKNVTIPLEVNVTIQNVGLLKYYVYIDNELLAANWLNIITANNITYGIIAYNITFYPPSEINVNVTHTIKVVVKGYTTGNLLVENETTKTFKIWYKGGFDNPLTPPEPTCVVFYDNQTGKYGYYEIGWVWDDKEKVWKPNITNVIYCSDNEIARKYDGTCACVPKPECTSNVECASNYKQYCDPNDEDHLTLVILQPKCINGTCEYDIIKKTCPAGYWCPPTADECVPYGECTPPVRYFCVNNTYSGRYVHVFNTTLGRCVWKLVEVIKCKSACYPETGKCDTWTNARPFTRYVNVNKTVIIGSNATLRFRVDDYDDELVEVIVKIDNKTIYKDWIRSGSDFEIPIGKLVEKYNIPEGNHTLTIIVRDPYWGMDVYTTKITIEKPVKPSAGGAAPIPITKNVTKKEMKVPTKMPPTGYFLAGRSTIIGLIAIVALGLLFYWLYRKGYVSA